MLLMHKYFPFYPTCTNKWVLIIIDNTPVNTCTLYANVRQVFINCNVIIVVYVYVAVDANHSMDPSGGEWSFFHGLVTQSDRWSTVNRTLGARGMSIYPDLRRLDCRLLRAGRTRFLILHLLVDVSVSTSHTTSATYPEREV